MLDPLTKTSIAQWYGQITTDNLRERCFLFCVEPSILFNFLKLRNARKVRVNVDI